MRFLADENFPGDAVTADRNLAAEARIFGVPVDLIPYSRSPVDSRNRYKGIKCRALRAADNYDIAS
jgi:hypothetical protein